MTLFAIAATWQLSAAWLFGIESAMPLTLYRTAVSGYRHTTQGESGDSRDPVPQGAVVDANRCALAFPRMGYPFWIVTYYYLFWIVSRGKYLKQIKNLQTERGCIKMDSQNGNTEEVES